jgi:hypothetical protein
LANERLLAHIVFLSSSNEGSGKMTNDLNIADKTLADIREECAADITTHKKGLAGRVLSVLHTPVDGCAGARGCYSNTLKGRSTSSSQQHDWHIGLQPGNVATKGATVRDRK